jgi:hypothetical protein
MSYIIAKSTTFVNNESWLLVLCLSALLGANETRIEPYKWYGEGALLFATTQSAKRASGVSSSARKQADQAQKQLVYAGVLVKQFGSHLLEPLLQIFRLLLRRLSRFPVGGFF